MTLIYIDSSAWVKRYFGERGSGWINRQFEKGILMGASTLGVIEVAATFARRRTTAAPPHSRFQQIEADLLHDWNGFFQIELTPDVVRRSLDLAKLCALRGADCVHLASAVVLKERLALEADEFALVTSDQELKAGALSAGLSVVDPQEEDETSAPPMA